MVSVGCNLAIGLKKNDLQCVPVASSTLSALLLCTCHSQREIKGRGSIAKVVAHARVAKRAWNDMGNSTRVELLLVPFSSESDWRTTMAHKNVIRAHRLTLALPHMGEAARTCPARSSRAERTTLVFSVAISRSACAPHTLISSFIHHPHQQLWSS